MIPRLHIVAEREHEIQNPPAAGERAQAQRLSQLVWAIIVCRRHDGAP